MEDNIQTLMCYKEQFNNLEKWEILYSCTCRHWSSMQYNAVKILILLWNKKLEAIRGESQSSADCFT
jgi:hypothetical protein